jgi:hypothetical protein
MAVGIGRTGFRSDRAPIGATTADAAACRLDPGTDNNVCALPVAAASPAPEVKAHLADLWTWRGSLGRGSYLFWGPLLFAIKYNIDRVISWHWLGLNWSWLDYARARQYLWPPRPSAADSKYFAFLLTIALPFTSFTRFTCECRAT